MRIFLIGMMGVGKTTLGRQLAQKLGYTFVDLDDYIVQREGRSITQIFEQEGQQKFRELERQALEAVVQEYEQAVIATGGGAPCFFDNMAFINKYGKSIFLDLPASELLQRLQNSDLSVRPLLSGKSSEELYTYLVKTIKERRRFYEQANYTLSEKNQTIHGLETLLNIK
ncbi:shikimate kinase [Pontibacter vulgaris]|uniref:shikimate kinase n=1 Tax=Pontibacter vulgaris TaxID=2905679 RepID=UPI001FA7A7BC|nr:shikimate kinase [Pontibacter vulgaris]